MTVIQRPMEKRMTSKEVFLEGRSSLTGIDIKIPRKKSVKKVESPRGGQTSVSSWALQVSSSVCLLLAGSVHRHLLLLKSLENLIVYVWVCIWVCILVPWYACRAQRTTCRTWFSHSTLWVLDLELSCLIWQQTSLHTEFSCWPLPRSSNACARLRILIDEPILSRKNCKGIKWWARSTRFSLVLWTGVAPSTAPFAVDLKRITL